ncbi:MAG TPA: adenylate/guanylate cyclase domain-containing protein [Gaiellaceae bacterium]|nr:adenylate/guanylate cyclase domain-containing protein [Gaiellaceae bacterium]
MLVCPSCGQENPAGAKFCNACGASLRAETGSTEQRKTVTVVFSDVTGSTALGERLDPESLRRVLARYFELASQVVERHGGAVEKFIGDAVMAVFGIPHVHEDDALRAVRAAGELGEALADLNAELERDFGTTLAVRIGINTGEVVTGTEERLATGDAVNVAARLEQAAEPGEILIGANTLRLVRDAVSVEAVRPLQAKGKSEPLAAYRLLSVDSEAPAFARRGDTPMVGRERQLNLLLNAFETVSSESSCHLVTVLGPAGVGKSRLVAEFISSLDGAAVVRGRCLSYGDGITYWPVVEVVKQIPGAETLVDGAAGQALEAVLGEGDAAATPDEIAWAFRKLLEARAAEAPLVCIFDDIQWGEETFLELVEHIADLSRGAPILLLCMARAELLERRPAWAGGKLNATTVSLEPLSETETDELIAGLLDGSTLDEGLSDRIRRAAGGNPLFVEEMLAFVDRSSNESEVEVPPTIQALLAARLDQLDPSERHVLERGSIEGEVFHRGGVAALVQDEAPVDGRLVSLVRKDLLRPELAQLAGEDGYRFRHLLIRDAAYETLPKATRAELHERFASWLEERGSELVEFDEIVGYHLEQAFRYRGELGPLTDHDRETGARAGTLLARSGRRALDRGDRRAARSLLERADGLLPTPSAEHVRALLDLGRSHTEVGGFQVGRGFFERAQAEAEIQAREDLRARVRIELFLVDLVLDPNQNVAAVTDAVAVLQRDGDDEGLARSWFALALSEWTQGQWDVMLEPLDRAIEHARRAESRSLEVHVLGFVLSTLTLGGTPIDEALRRADEYLEDWADSRELQGFSARMRGNLLAHQGQVEEGRALLREARQIFAELGHREGLSLLPFSSGRIELMEGDPVAAERELRSGVELMEEIGDRSRAASLIPLLADALTDQGRIDEAEQLLDAAREAAPKDDPNAEAFRRTAEARVLVRRGAFDEAVRLANEGIAMARRTQELLTLPDLLVYQAEVLQMAGQPAAAEAALREAADAAARKGSLGYVRRVDERLAALAATQPSRGPS